MASYIYMQLSQRLPRLPSVVIARHCSSNLTTSHPTSSITGSTAEAAACNIAGGEFFDPGAERNAATKHVDTQPTVTHEFPAAHGNVERSTAEWHFVERLFPKTFIKKPNVAPGTRTPGGYVAPSARPGDLPYYVNRTSNFLPRVHLKRNFEHYTVMTVVSGVEGDVFQLAAELKAHLVGLYGTKETVVLQVLEPHQKIFFKGDFVNDIKQFLEERGF